MTRGVFLADKAFTVNRLTAVQRVWYDRLWGAIHSPRLDPNPHTIAATGSPELVGFSVKQHVGALLWALDATGNEEFLFSALEPMAVLRARIDAGAFPAGTDKDRAFLASLYALVALVCRINAGADERHAEAADYWYRQTLTLCRNGAVPSDNLTHAFAASIETAWYLYLLTGEARYQWDAEAKRVSFWNGLYSGGNGRVWWDHRTFEARSMPGNGVQRMDYGRYTLQSLVFLHRTGLEILPMAALVDTVLGVVRANGTIAYTMDGRDAGGLSKLTGSFWGVVARYDESGALAARLAERANANQVYIPAALVTV